MFYNMEILKQKTYSKSVQAASSPVGYFSACPIINKSINNQNIYITKNAATLTSGCIKTEFL